MIGKVRVMNNKYLLISIVLILLSSFASASELLHYNYSDLVDYSGNGFTANNVGASSIANYPVYNISGNSSPNSFYFDGGDYVGTGSFSYDWDGSDWAISIWTKYTGVLDTDFRGIFSNRFTDTTAGWITFGKGADDVGICGVGNNVIAIEVGTVDYICSSFDPLNAGWFHSIINKNGNTLELYINNSLEGSLDISSNNLGSVLNDLRVGEWFASDDRWIGNIDEFRIFTTSLSSVEIYNLFNCGELNCITTSNFTILANVNNFTAIINGSDYNATLNTTTGSIVTGILENSSFLYNISLLATGYFDEEYLNYNVSVNPLNVVFEDGQGFHVDFDGFVDYNSTNYTRVLELEYHFDHCPSNNTANTFINGVKNNNLSFVVNCTSFSDVFVYRNYTHGVEGLFNISFNGTYQSGLDSEVFELNSSNFTSDLVNPSVFGNFSIVDGFVSSKDINISLNCTDGITPLLLYNVTYNDNNIFYGNKSNSSLQENTTTLEDGVIELFFSCSDFFGSRNDSISDVAYSNTLYLIDEVDNTLFDPANVSSARVYFDDNSSFYDFKAAGKSSVNFTSLDMDKLRFEVVYSDGTVITRFVDVSLDFTNGNIRVCANKEGVTHFEQLVISSTDTRPVIIHNIFSNCVIAQDYTRFAYQDAFVLKAFTVSSLYSLFTYDDRNEQLFLASLDGSISSFINLDTLEFSQTPYNLNILGDGLSFQKSDTNEVTIYYENLNDNNLDLSLVITRLDTDSVVFTQSSFSDKNKFTLIFDYSTLSNVTENTLFKLSLNKTTADGEITINRYFNTAGKTGLLKAEVAFMISFSLIFIGLTFVITRTAFSWFGIIVSIAAIGIATLGINTWYILFLESMEVIVLIYVLIVSINQNSSQLA